MVERIAVEAGLDYVKEYLTRQGYDVVDLTGGNQQVAAMVVSGLDADYLGISNRTTDAPVINAEGRTPQEILSDLKERLQQAK